MIDPKKQAEMDQMSSTIAELCPPLWRALFKGCCREGFSEEQSLELVKAFILKDNCEGIKP